ncbi:acetate--CoA ligase family protein [Pseudonocardia kujensis]|uniref:acetate--CoA ligase family protein n=1 Tax=Pseudonocardia kujensis TaxID=1128675 RepID=UPI001E5674E2|nr:acetate--CoA ligase family protein [Pseudonocardia kujensis]MCE0762390.1 acetate--CoA ligase family protein [Pseudonocardia kujensis]
MAAVTPTDWERVLNPRTVAVLGASGRADSPMARPLRWLAERGFAGRVVPVNPKYPELAGLPCAASLADVAGSVDLVLAMVPADRAVQAVRDSGAAGAAAVIVFASGFAEVGPEGAALQASLVAAGRETGVRVLGPNCQGIVHTPSRLFASFSAAAERPLIGSSGIAYVGQSGAIGGSVLDLAAERGLDLTTWVSTGNQADVDLTEIGLHLVQRPEIAVLAVYAEDVPDGAAYARLAETAATHDTALVVLRSGWSAAGRRAAVSHTGAMAGDDTAFRLVSRRHGVVLVDDVEELLAAATMLRGQPRPAGRGVAAVTTSGGAGILAADRCEGLGLVLPVLAPETQDKLARVVPDFGAIANPVDVTAQLFNRGDRAFGDVCGIACADPSVDSLLVLVTMVTGQEAVDLAADLAAAMAGSPVPCAVAWLAGPDRTAEARALLTTAGIPVFGSIAVASKMLAVLVCEPGPDSPAATAPHADLPEDGWKLLDALGIARPAGRVARNPEEAAGIAAELGRPVVLKAEGLAHKSDVGGVRVGVPLDRVAAESVGLFALGAEVLVQETAPAGFELLIGATGSADGWPPVITVGLGGVATEVHRDLATALGPLDHDAALALLRTLRSWPLLAGHRGSPPLDVDAAAAAVVAVSRAAAHPRVAELEINPLIVGREGAVAVDVLLRHTDTGRTGGR